MKDAATCIIVDDEPLAIRLLKSHLEQTPRLKLVGAFDNPLEALAFLRESPPDLILLDIQMPVLTGMEIARILNPTPAIIFTTAYRNYAVESYELEVLDYLVKPITFPRFYQAIDKFFQQHESATTTPLPTTNTATYRYFNVNKKHVKVELTAITHIESLKDYIRIHTQEQRLVTKERISELAQTLPAHFLRVHRSFIVNLHQVSAFTATDLEIGKLEIPIGPSYKDHVMEALKM